MVATPSGISYRINAERILIVAWLRAILLQLAHPLIAAGVAEHSTFRGSTMAALFRLHHTIAAMLAISFGADRERNAALDGIRSIHRRVHGKLPVACGPFAAGTRYSAEDPELLRWVHVTLIQSVLLGYQQLVGPLPPAERDRYCAESADVAIELGAPAEAIPRSWNALHDAVERGYASGTIVVSDQARTLAAALVTPFGGWVGRRAVSPILSLLAAGQLPPMLRAQYCLPWDSTRERRFMRLIALLRALRRLTPRRIAWWTAARGRPIACLAKTHGYTPAIR
jgi:uncharacterized protein (DUF2236 family)